MDDDKVPEKSVEAASAQLPPEKTIDVEEGENSLERTLKGRHLQFIAIGATLGTGLFIGTGSGLTTAGPVSLLIAFLFIGLVLYSVMVGLGEMVSYLPVSGAFTVYAGRFIDPTLGFAVGWMYWFSWAITFALELSAAGLVIQYWDHSLNPGIWIGVFWVIFSGVNFLPVRWLGELEMWLSLVKVITVVGFVIFAICVNAGVGDKGYLGFYYWAHPGPFVEYIVHGGIGKFVGFWSVLVTAGLAYQGTELVAMGAGETADPRKTIPSAIRWAFWGILSMFISFVFFVSITVPSDNDKLNLGTTDAAASPLVIAAQLAGVKVLPDIINAVILTAVLTAANSNVYSSSRILVGLAEVGNAPGWMRKTTSWGTPHYAVAFSVPFGLLGFLNLSDSGSAAFGWLLNITSIAGFIAWTNINLCHLRFMKALAYRGISRSELPYRAPFQPYLSWFGLVFNALIILTNGFAVFIRWDTTKFFVAYVSLIIFIVLYVGHKLWFRTKIVPLDKVDLSMGRLYEYCRVVGFRLVLYFLPFFALFCPVLVVAVTVDRT